MDQRKLEVLAGLESAVKDRLHLLAPVDKLWWPSNFLPDNPKEDFHDQQKAFADEADKIPYPVLAVLVGDMVTEEALPSYSLAIAALTSFKRGTEKSAWGTWVRGWTAEENRHGNVLNAYLRLTRRVNMPAVERTVQSLISIGFDTGLEYDPFADMMYPAFQEEATKISHRNVGLIAARSGAIKLNEISSRIAGDEARHAQFYQTICGELFRQDPSSAVLSWKELLMKGVTMPAKNMYDGRDPNLFDNFEMTAQAIGAYTARDYLTIVTKLTNLWNIPKISVSGDAAKAQDYICNRFPRVLERQLGRIEDKARKAKPAQFSWIYH